MSGLVLVSLRCTSLVCSPPSPASTCSALFSVWGSCPKEWNQWVHWPFATRLRLANREPWQDRKERTRSSSSTSFLPAGLPLEVCVPRPTVTRPLKVPFLLSSLLLVRPPLNLATPLLSPPPGDTLNSFFVSPPSSSHPGLFHPVLSCEAPH